MSLRSIARRYALALADTLPDDAALRRTEAELSALAEALRDDAELRALLAGPALPASSREEAADVALASAGASEATRKFARLLVRRHRLGMATEVAEELSAIVRQRLGIVDAEVVTARPLEDTLRQRALQSLGRLTGREVRARFRVEPGLLGGLRARIGNTIFDGSLRGRLQRLREEMAGE